MVTVGARPGRQATFGRLEGIRYEAIKRRDYAEVAGLIITLRGLGEPLAAQQMVQRLLEAYPRKPAFREELLRYDYLPG